MSDERAILRTCIGGPADGTQYRSAYAGPIHIPVEMGGLWPWGTLPRDRPGGVWEDGFYVEVEVIPSSTKYLFGAGVEPGDQTVTFSLATYRPGAGSLAHLLLYEGMTRRTYEYQPNGIAA